MLMKSLQQSNSMSDDKKQKNIEGPNQITESKNNLNSDEDS